MRHLSKAASKTFEQLTDGLAEPGDARKIDNTGGAFMPVSVSVIERTPLGLVVSVTHYYQLNGDLCCDPDMTFLVAPAGVFPLTFQQAIPPVFTQAATIEADGKVRCATHSQRDITIFANSWLRNIQQQQFGRTPRPMPRRSAR